MHLWGGMGRESRVSDLFHMTTGEALLVIGGLEAGSETVEGRYGAKKTEADCLI